MCGVVLCCDECCLQVGLDDVDGTDFENSDGGNEQVGYVCVLSTWVYHDVHAT